MLKKMYLVAFDYRMADGSLPRFGDAVQDSISKPFAGNEAAYAAYHDARLLANLSAKPTWDSVILGRRTGDKPPALEGGSKVFPGTGNAVLRTNGPGRLSAAITFSPHGGFHGHFDKLSFVFFGDGRELGVDPGHAASQAYGLPIHKDWYRATIGHNAVLVNGRGQKEADGQLVAFGATADWAGVTADAGRAFEGVVQRRTLILGPACLVVVDHLKATDEKERRFAWLYHNLGSGMACDLPAAKVDLVGVAGSEYLKHTKAYYTDRAGTIAVSFSDSAGDVRLMMAGQPGDTVITADGPFRSVEDRVPMAAVQRRGSEVTFVAVIEPLPKGGPATVKGVTVSTGPVVRIDCGGRSDVVTFQGGAAGGIFRIEETGGDQALIEKLSVKP